MQAIIAPRYGSADVLQLKDVAKPAPQPDQVLIKVQAVALNSADVRLLAADPFLVRIKFGLTKPKVSIFGADIAGRVEAVGSHITQFKPGDEVFGDLALCGFGGLAEYVCAPEQMLALKPARLSFAQTAAVPMAGITALQGLRNQGKLQPGQKVAINGASGGVGTFAIQLAKAFGAHVTAICSSRNLEQARSLGADQVIDYTKADFTQNGQRYDLIVAVNGYHPLRAYKRALAEHGSYVMIGGRNAQLFQGLLLGPLMSLASNKKMGSLHAQSNQQDLNTLKDLIEAGKVMPLIDRQYALAEAVEAFRYVQAGHARGKVVITL